MHLVTHHLTSSASSRLVKMPRQTDRQALTDVLLESFVLHRYVEFSAQIMEEILSIDDEDGSDTNEDPPLQFSDTLLLALRDLHSRRYLEKHPRIRKSSATLTIILDDHKLSRPDIFRRYLRVSPEAFDALLAAISEHPVFENSSQNEQAPVKYQLAVALYRFGHYGNGASMVEVGMWAGIGWGTVDLYTRRVMMAVCEDKFRKSAIRWPDAEEKEAAKTWIEAQSCPAWRNGFVMVDETGCVLHSRPAFYGNSFYDRKQKYSLNVQIVNTPNLRIRDYSIGLPGSQHDATAWKQTRIYTEHASLLSGDEFVFADSAYPISGHVVAPYKVPEKFEDRNEEFNYYLSQCRIRSEHTMGYWKGWCSSLRGIRARVDSPEQIQFAVWWVIACMAIHNFAIEVEHIGDFSMDEFFQAGQKIIEEERGKGRGGGGG